MAGSIGVLFRRAGLPLLNGSYHFNNNPRVFQSLRTLYAKTTLGLDTFERQQQQVHNQMGNLVPKFKEKMLTYVDDPKTMVFTEDLKNMTHLAENDEDIEIVVNMMKKFNQQNKQLRFGSFIFGPVVMRMFYKFNKPDLAVECFLAPELEGFFDQLISYQLLLDLLYENQKYEDILKCFDVIKERQIEGAKYPKNPIVLTLAACYKLNTEESFAYATKLWQELMQTGHVPMRKAATFCAGLALRQNRPEVVIEVLGVVRNQNYTTIRNLKVAAYCKLGRVEDAIPILKSILTEDRPNFETSHTFNKDVIAEVKEAVAKLDNADIALEFNRLEQLFQKQGQIADNTLDDQLCIEIQTPSLMSTRQRQDDRYGRRGDWQNNRKDFRGGFQNRTNRPGLRDLS